MKGPTCAIVGKAILLMGLTGMVCPNAWAETVYKCVTAGKTNFASAPQAGQNCQAVELHVVQPSPGEVARQLEQQRLRDEEQQREQKKAKAEAKQAGNEQALKRAKSAEQALRLLRDSPPRGGYGRSRGWNGLFPGQSNGRSRRYLFPEPQ
jgi:uncharacterized iron-regulated membrane protein